jgi:hypothetical protein
MLQTVKDATRELGAAGINTRPKPGTKGEEALAKFQASLRQQLVVAQMNKKAPLTPDEAKAIALGEVKEQALAHTGIFGIEFLDTKKAPYEMTDEERAGVWTVPDEERTKIIGALQRNKMPVNEENIQRIYKAAQGKR